MALFPRQRSWTFPFFLDSVVSAYLQPVALHLGRSIPLLEKWGYAVGFETKLQQDQLLETVWADASGVERIPHIAALAEPVIFLAGRPAAERAADARRF